MGAPAIILALMLRAGAAGAGLGPELGPAALEASRTDVATLPYVEVLTGGARADEPLPLVVVLHGRGGSPARFAERFERWPGRARVVVVGGPMRAGRGRAWFSRPVRSMDDAELDAQLEARVEAVARTLDEVRRRHPTPPTRTVLAGYSQGATVALALALRRPELADEVVVASSWLPTRWIPERSVDAPLIAMSHGGRDRKLPLREALSVEGELASRGYAVRLRQIASAEHRLEGRAHGVFLGRLRLAVDRPRAG